MMVQTPSMPAVSTTRRATIGSAVGYAVSVGVVAFVALVIFQVLHSFAGHGWHNLTHGSH